MPRGNDSQAALVDLQGQFAGAGGNAEQLINSAKLSITPELRTALLLPRDEAATKALLEDEGLEGVQKHVDEGTVVDAAVRGDWVVAVIEVESGRTFKVPVQRTKLGGPKPLRAIPERDSGEQEMVERQKEALRTLAVAQAAAEEAQRAAEKARAEFLEEQAKAREAANDRKGEAKREAVKADEKK